MEVRNSFKLIKVDRDIWLMSNYSGEIIRPWEIRKAINLIIYFWKHEHKFYRSWI